jgi:hypothetical protein
MPGKNVPLSDAQLRLRLEIFLEYASSRSLFKKYVDLNDILNVFRARGKAKESEGTLRRHATLIMQRAGVDGDGKLCVNEFLYALIQRGQAFEGLLLRAYRTTETLSTTTSLLYSKKAYFNST